MKENILNELKTIGLEILHNIDLKKEGNARHYYSAAKILLDVYREQKKEGLEESALSDVLARETMSEIVTRDRKKIKNLNLLVHKLEAEFASGEVLSPESIALIITLLTALIKLITELVESRKRLKKKKKER